MVHRVSMTLGRSSQAQNIAASRLLTFSGSQPSRRRSRILRLSLIFATFDTSISSSVFFSVRCRFARSSSSPFSLRLFVCLCAHQPLPTSRHLERYLERHLLQQQCYHSQHHHLQWRRWGLHCWSSRDLLVCRRTGA